MTARRRRRVTRRACAPESLVAGPSERRGDRVETALKIGWETVALAALIALFAAGASLIRSRPALVHALWLLVLLKLLTPPVWGVRIDRVWARAIEPTAGVSRATAVEIPAVHDEPITETSPPIARLDSMPVETEPVFANPRAEKISPPPTAAPPISNRSTNHAFVVWLPTAATLLWAAGSAVCAALILLRLV